MAALLVGVLVGTGCGATRCWAQTQTITTTYQYNADGAPTAVTTQVDAQPATTSYLTWDNFTPNSAAPTTGTVTSADGNLLGIGPSPGTTGLTTQFAYDSRDRLTGCSPAGQSAVSYTYHPASLMASSTLASGDALQFYYDTGAAPLMVNTRQPSTGLVSSFLGPVRYVSDGTEQVLLEPRKDTAGVYDAAAQTMSPYSYEPYGGPLSSSAAAPSGLASDGTSYDLTQNPFQYASEYKDPTCSAYYLRARWMLPTYETFLSRDPGDLLHRYSYTAGDPIGRTDPSGLKYTGEDFSRAVDKAVGKLTPGLWAYVEPVLPVWGQVLGGIELVGLLPSFWHHPTTEGMITFGFLAASIVSEAGAEAPQIDRLSPFLLNPERAFGARIGIDLTLGASQTAAQSDQHGRIDVPALIQGVDTTLFGTFYARAVGGIGYRPYNMTSENVDSLATDFHANDANRGRTLVFAGRQSVGGDQNFTTPILQAKTIGLFHESMLFVGRDKLVENEVNVYDNFVKGSTVEAMAVGGRKYSWAGGVPSDTTQLGVDRYRYIGSFADQRVAAVVRKSPLNIPGYPEQSANIRRFGVAKDTPYDMFSRNCHDHAAGLIRLLQQP